MIGSMAMIPIDTEKEREEAAQQQERHQAVGDQDRPHVGLRFCKRLSA